jgi:hypothetical protein
VTNLDPHTRKKLVVEIGERLIKDASSTVEEAGGNIFDYFQVLGEIGHRLAGLRRP